MLQPRLCPITSHLLIFRCWAHTHPHLCGWAGRTEAGAFTFISSRLQFQLQLRRSEADKENTEMSG